MDELIPHPEKLFSPTELALGTHRVEKFNKNHDSRGRFAKTSGGGGGTSGGSFEDTTPEGRLDAFDWKGSRTDIQRELSQISKGRGEARAVRGNLSEKNVDAVMANARAELDRYTNYLAGDSVSLMHRYLNDTERLLKGSVGEFKGTKARDMDALLRDNVQKILYQEIQSNRQQFTDHGVRHITKNVVYQQQVFNALDKEGIKVTGRERFLANFAMVNHDMGYTHPMVRGGGMSGVKASAEHPAYSGKVFAEQEAVWDRGKVFTKAEYDKATELVRYHNSTKLDPKNPLLLATSLADNTALFHGEKLPGMFAYVPRSTTYLQQMQRAVKAGDDKAFDAAKGKLLTSLNSTNLSPALKRDLTAAVGEANKLTPKFTLGLLAGQIESLSHGKVPSDGVIKVSVKSNKYDQFLQQHFEMGQKQTKKLLETYGITDFTQKHYSLGEYNGKPLLTIEVR